MGYTNKYIEKAVLNNDIEVIMEVLDEAEFLKGELPPRPTFARKQTLSIVLSFASAMAYREKLDDEVAEELVERLAMTVNIFQLIKLAEFSAEIGAAKTDKIPSDLKRALRKNAYSDEMAKKLDGMSKEAFQELIVFLASGNEVEQLHAKFSLPIVRQIRRHQLLPDDLLFAFMASSPHISADDVFGEMAKALGFGVLGPFPVPNIFGDED